MLTLFFFGLLQRFDERAIEVGIDDGGVDVGLAANCGGVAQAPRDSFDCLDDVTFGLRVRLRGFHLLESLGGKHGPGPGTEVFSGEIVAADLIKVIVHVRRVDRAARAVIVYVLEKLLLG